MYIQVGILILLAIIVRRKPDVLQHQATSLRNQFQAQDQLPTLVWVYGQVRTSLFAHGHVCLFMPE